ILIGQTSNPHTAKRYFGSVKVAACNFDRIHLLPLVLKTIFGDCVLTHYNVDSIAQPVGLSKSAKHNRPRFDTHTCLYQLTGVDLTRIDGIEAGSALALLSETRAIATCSGIT